MFSGITVLLPHVKAWSVARLSRCKRHALAAAAAITDTHTVRAAWLHCGDVDGRTGTARYACGNHRASFTVRIVNMVANAEVREKLLAQGAQPVGNKPDEFRAFIRR
jgi:hypothetical protein